MDLIGLPLGLYILVCIGNGKNDGKYVSLPGSEYAYTGDLSKADRFSSEEEAKNHACGNERVVKVVVC